MKRMLPLVLLLAACAATPEYPPPQAQSAQVVIKVTATPKAGVKPPRTEGQYEKESVEKGRRFTRVNYSEMDCIAVVVRPAFAPSRLEFGRNPRPEAIVSIGADGFSRDLVAVCMDKVALYGSRMSAAVVSFENRRGKPLTLFGAVQGGEETFELTVAPGAKRDCTLAMEGIYDVYCDEDEKLFCQIVVTRSPFVALCESGGEVFFDALPPGQYEVEVYAPRLPLWRAKFNAVAGKREMVYAEVTVNGLPKAK